VWLEDPTSAGALPSLHLSLPPPVLVAWGTHHVPFLVHAPRQLVIARCGARATWCVTLLSRRGDAAGAEWLRGMRAGQARGQCGGPACGLLVGGMQAVGRCMRGVVEGSLPVAMPLSAPRRRAEAVVEARGDARTRDRIGRQLPSCSERGARAARGRGPRM